MGDHSPRTSVSSTTRKLHRAWCLSFYIGFHNVGMVDYITRSLNSVSRRPIIFLFFFTKRNVKETICFICKAFKVTGCINRKSNIDHLKLSGRVKTHILFILSCHNPHTQDRNLSHKPLLIDGTYVDLENKCRLKFHFSHLIHILGWLLYKRKTENNSVVKSGEIRTLMLCWWESKIMHLLWKIVW